MEISFTTIDPMPFVIGGVVLGLILSTWTAVSLKKSGISRRQLPSAIALSLVFLAMMPLFGLLVGYVVAIAHGENQRAEAFERLSSELGVEVAADRSAEDFLVSPGSVTMLSEPFTISYEIDGAVYQPTVVAKLVESSGQSHRFALYLQPGTSGELIELSADSLIAENELEEAR